MRKRKPKKNNKVYSPKGQGEHGPIGYIPPYIEECLSTYKLKKEDVKLSLMMDFTMDFCFGESWLIATPGELCVISGENVPEKGWMPGFYDIYEYEKYKDLVCENLPTSGILSLKNIETEEKIIVGRISNGKAREASMFIKHLGILREKGDITLEDMEEHGPGHGHGPRSCKKCGGPLKPHNGEVCDKCVDKKKVFSRLMEYAKHYKVQVIITLSLLLLSALFMVVGTYISGKIYMDEVLNPEGKYYGMIFPVVLLMIAVSALSKFLDALSGRVNAKFASDVIYRLKTETFASMQKLSIKFFTDRETGNLMTRINNDSNEVQWFFIDGIPRAILMGAQLVSAIIIMAMMSPLVTVLVLIPIPFLFMFTRTFMPRFFKMFRRSHKRRSDLNSTMNNSFAGRKVVKAFGREEQEVENFDDKSIDFATVETRISKTGATLFPFAGTLMWIGSLLVYLVGGLQIMNGNLLFGELTTMVSYAGMLYSPIQWFTGMIQHFARALQAANRVFEVMDSVSDVPEKDNPYVKEELTGHVKLENVCFSYIPNVPVLTDVSLDVKPGEMIGIVGHSGAGKTTLINLITRMYDVDSGGIYIDDVNVKDYSFDCLRRGIGIVLQDTYLFTGTVADNIAYAKPGATRDEIIAAAKDACAHNFIMNLSDGYDTYIGGGAQSLSGGERQRIALARAILMNPKILVLDEATSAVDTKTEMEIQSAMEKFSKGRTTFNIAHRLSTLRNADRLIVIEGGKIVETGTHWELSKIEGGVYKRLYDIQKEALKVRGLKEEDGN
ncbi:MAG: ABC transporter ATP-binding protein [Ruminococcaceae bacterium]|nr:ABC transporter ATP-binding protein [Oscillospiraceae bacterium]